MRRSARKVLGGIAAALAFSGASHAATIPPIHEMMPLDRMTLPEHFISEVKRIPMPDVGEAEVWVRIDLYDRELVVYRGKEMITSIPHVGIGNSGAQRVRLQGSRMTPLGEFKIERINRQSQFNTFYGINYPTQEVVEEALTTGLISPVEYRRFMRDKQRGRMTPAYTSLGGHIGIHGLGSRDPRIHERYDWTDGCLALKNDDLKRIDPWLRPGTTVLIHG